MITLSQTREALLLHLGKKVRVKTVVGDEYNSTLVLVSETYFATLGAKGFPPTSIIRNSVHLLKNTSLAVGLDTNVRWCAMSMYSVTVDIGEQSPAVSVSGSKVSETRQAAWGKETYTPPPGAPFEFF